MTANEDLIRELAKVISDPERVETVARALWIAQGRHPEDWGTSELTTFRKTQDELRRLAAAAIAAMPPSPAEGAVKRVEALAEQWKSEGGWTESYVADLRAALASPAPAPQRPEPVCFCGRLGHRLGGPILHKRTEECPR